MEQKPLISVIIPTVGRESLNLAVNSVLIQDLGDHQFEIIIVNDSGSDLIDSEEFLDDPRVRLISTNRRYQCFARNAGAAIARGDYLLFLDDDDRLVYGGLSALLDTIQGSPTAIVAYGGFTFVDGKNRILGTNNLGTSGNCSSQLLAGAWIQFGSACIRSDAFFAVGGLDTSLIGAVENDLFRRLAIAGDFSNTETNIVEVLRGEGWASSMKYTVSGVVDCLRISREKLLDQHQAFGRILDSAKLPYWHGRVFKALIASVYWNLRQRRCLKSVSRLVLAVRALSTFGAGVLQFEFYRALRDTQVPESGHLVVHS